MARLLSVMVFVVATALAGAAFAKEKPERGHPTHAPELSAAGAAAALIVVGGAAAVVLGRRRARQRQ